MAKYDFKLIADAFASRPGADTAFVADIDRPEHKFYSLGMFPYPSGNAHMGHVRVYSISDVKARFKKLQGANVLHPIGWDSFGLPAENAAIKNNVPPADWTAANVRKMRNEQLGHMGWSFDWSKEIDTSSPEYYRWTQWLFVKLFEHGKAVRRLGPVNWCDVDQTALADEQVVDGRCWRDGSVVQKRQMEQWYFKITDYADDLWAGLETLKNWAPEAVAVQRNWIGRNTGALIDFAVEGRPETITVFTTRADTLFGVSALVLAPENPLVAALLASRPNPELAAYVEAATRKSAVERKQNKEKTGVATGFTVRHPFDTDATLPSIPLHVADYVIGNYGTGAVMCVPCHDTRDGEYAQIHGLARIEVVRDAKNPQQPSTDEFVDDGVLVASGPFTGMTSADARRGILAALEQRRRGRETLMYQLRDWSVGRQRYWGCPIPIVYCDACGTLAEKRLPVLLPPPNPDRALGRLSLKDVPEFVNTTCPKCGGAARRETDTLDTFVDSAWYAFRFVDPRNTSLPFDRAKVDHWMPIDFYVGGIEHAALHMLYFRFITRFLHEVGLVGFTEPVDHFFCNGMVKLDGAKMSKSRGNLVVPTEIVDKYGADALRLAILSDTPAEFDVDWNENAIQGKYEFLSRIFRVVSEFLETVTGVEPSDAGLAALSSTELLHDFYGDVAKIAQGLETNSFHTCIARLHELSSSLLRPLANAPESARPALKYLVREYLVVLGVFAPLLADYLYRTHFDARGSLYSAAWPATRTEYLTRARVSIAVQVNGKKRAVIEVDRDASSEDVERIAFADPAVRRAIENQSIKKKMYVPNRILNVVVGS